MEIDPAWLGRWDQALARMQRKHPARWSVRGWSPEEVRDELTLRLLEVMTREGACDALVVARARLSELRKANRLDQRVADIPDAPVRLPPPATGEARMIETEADALRASARQRAEASLTQPQRRWYAAMRMAANAGEFFEASDELNLSAAARLLDRNRSSAARAYEELRATFTRELEREE